MGITCVGIPCSCVLPKWGKHMKNKRNDRLVATKLKDEDLERLLFDAFREAGWILPMTYEDVIRAEKDQADKCTKVPEHLSDVEKVLEDMHKRETRFLSLLLKKVARG